MTMCSDQDMSTQFYSLHYYLSDTTLKTPNQDLSVNTTTYSIAHNSIQFMLDNEGNSFCNSKNSGKIVFSAHLF